MHVFEMIAVLNPFVLIKIFIAGKEAGTETPETCRCARRGSKFIGAS